MKHLRIYLALMCAIINSQKATRLLSTFCVFICSGFCTVLFAANDGLWTKFSGNDKLAVGTRVKIYPYKKDGISNMALSSNTTDATLTSTEKAGAAGSVWTLLDAGGVYFYLVNDLGLYWSYQQNDVSTCAMSLTSDRSKAVAVEMRWKSSDSGIIFFRAPNASVLNNLHGSNNQYNWYGKGFSDDNSSFILYVSNSISKLEFDTKRLTILKGVSSTIDLAYAPTIASTKDITVKSSDTSIATVTTSSSYAGTVVVSIKGCNTGTATITAKASDGSGMSASCTVTVTDIFDGGKIEKKATSISDLTSGTSILIYPYEKDGIGSMELSSNTTDAVLTSSERAGKGGNVWTLLSAGDGYFYLVNELGQYWAYQQSNKSSVAMSLTSSKSNAVKVKPVWNTKYPGVAFQNANDNTYLNNLYGYNYRYNWYKGTGNALTYDNNNTYNVYIAKIHLVTNIQLSKSMATILRNERLSLTAAITPEDAEDKSVTWSSSNNSVATVDQKGIVTGRKAGTATITAMANDGSGTYGKCEVTVTPIKVKEITLPEKIDVLWSTTAKIEAQVSPDDADDNSVRWTSRDESIATVDQNGVVTGVKEGITTITATAKDGSGVTATCRVNVKPVVIELSTKTINLRETQTYAEQEVRVLPESYEHNEVFWKTSDASVATVSNDGTITAVKPGIATITYSLTYDSKVKTECKVIVYDQSVVYVGGLYYILDGNSKKATVTGIYGANGNGFDEEKVAQYYSGTVNIPSTVTYDGITYDVTNVGGYAFVCQNDLQSIYIPSSVVTVEPYAATNAKNLQLVNVEDGSQLQNIGIHAFRECTGLRLFTFDGTTNKMKSIDAYAFYGDTKLERIKWSGTSTVNTIGDYAFYKCTSLNNVVMPNSVTTVGNYSFRYDESLTDITLSTSLNIINEYAFGECGFSGITLPESLASMQAGAFINNKYLTEITIPAKVQGIGAAAFENNSALQTVTFKTSIGTMTIGDNAFNQCPILNKVNIDHLDSWAQTNFSNAKANPANTAHHIYMNDVEIINVKLPDGTKYINNNAFNGCSSIVSLTVPETVDRISDDIIYGCSSLTDVYCYAEEVPTFIGTLDPSSMADVFRQATLHVIYGKESAYKVDTWWGRFYNIAGCDKPEPEPEKVTGITLSQSEATLKPDDTLQLTATVYPTDAADKSVTWESSDEAVVMVTDEGFVLALAEGTADITATANDGSGVSATCHITVEADKEPEVIIASLSLDKSVTLMQGESKQLVATISPENATNKTLTWKSANESVATVDEEGNVLGVSVGKSIITAKTTDGSNLTANCVVTVTKATGIDGINSDEADGSAYYTINGIKLDKKPQQEGVYIRVKDGKSQKLVIKNKLK